MYSLFIYILHFCLLFCCFDQRTSCVNGRSPWLPLQGALWLQAGVPASSLSVRTVTSLISADSVYTERKWLHPHVPTRIPLPAAAVQVVDFIFTATLAPNLMTSS